MMSLAVISTALESSNLEVASHLRRPAGGADHEAGQAVGRQQLLRMCASVW